MAADEEKRRNEEKKEKNIIQIDLASGLLWCRCRHVIAQIELTVSNVISSEANDAKSTQKMNVDQVLFFTMTFTKLRKTDDIHLYGCTLCLHLHSYVYAYCQCGTVLDENCDEIQSYETSASRMESMMLANRMQSVSCSSSHFDVKMIRSRVRTQDLCDVHL